MVEIYELIDPAAELFHFDRNAVMASQLLSTIFIVLSSPLVSLRDCTGDPLHLHAPGIHEGGGAQATAHWRIGQGSLAMCGIAGAIGLGPDRSEARVHLLNDAQRHRGPDHSVVVRVGGITIGNTRLAIQHPNSAGNQPFVSSDGRFHCVFNGEIYNHRRLVERYGLTVQTTCDGEIIPELWAKLGVASLAELRGMFAIAMVDSVEERLYLARDPFGIKPLHWRMIRDGLIFASEIRPLVRAGGGARINPEAIARYLHLGAVARDQAPFAEITTLPPNSVAIFDLDCRATMLPILPGGPLRAIEAPQGLEAALRDSIELHLGADVPTALLLSAGVDSATIAAISRRFDQDLDCVTVATEDETDESAGAALTARHYGHRFMRIPASLDDGDLAKFFAAMQRPSVDGLNTYLVCKAVHEAGFKVAISGLGGDEAIGGYSHFRLLRYLPALRTLDRLPGVVSTAAVKILARAGAASEAKLERLLGPDGPREGRGFSKLQRELLPAPLAAALTGTRCCNLVERPARRLADRETPFGTMVSAEVDIYLQALLLPDADSFSMASSVELRVPFVDSAVFAAALALAPGKGGSPGKDAIGIALSDPYLRKLATRPKLGFSVPMRSWMTGPLAATLTVADEPDAAVWSLVDRAVAKRAGLLPLQPRERWSESWALAALNAWLDAD